MNVLYKMRLSIIRGGASYGADMAETPGSLYDARTVISVHGRRTCCINVENDVTAVTGLTGLTGTLWTEIPPERAFAKQRHSQRPATGADDVGRDTGGCSSQV